MGLCCFCVLLGYLPASCGAGFPDHKTFCNRSRIKDNTVSLTYIHHSVIDVYVGCCLILWAFGLKTNKVFIEFRCVSNSFTCSPALIKHFNARKKCLYIYSCLQGVNCWHDLDNTEYDCWPINSPNDYNMISCGGKFLYIYLSFSFECFIAVETADL